MLLRSGFGAQLPDDVTVEEAEARFDRWCAARGNTRLREIRSGQSMATRSEIGARDARVERCTFLDLVRRHQEVPAGSGHQLPALPYRQHTARTDQDAERTQHRYRSDGMSVSFGPVRVGRRSLSLVGGGDDSGVGE